MKRVTFRSKDNLQSVVNNRTNKKTTLTEWLEYNKYHTNGRHLTYLNFPSEYTWYPTDKYWKCCRNLIKPSIGRLTYVHQSLGEQFYERLLICHQKGCKNINYIRTVNDTMYPTNRAACEALGLLNNDQEWVLKTKFQELVFVYGHGGTGKTFLWKAITCALHLDAKIVLVVTSSGIAALLLPAGRKAHSRFEIPLNLKDECICNIKKNNHLADLLKETDLIIWDEAPMNDRRCFEAPDRSLRDILDNPHTLFGGKSIMLGGDFRQALPPQMTEDEKKHVHTFSNWLLNIGDGNIGEADEVDPENSSWVYIPDHLCIPDSDTAITELINFIYDDQTFHIPMAKDLQKKGYHKCTRIFNVASTMAESSAANPQKQSKGKMILFEP
ncbi:DNA helicase [Tanacetum coccineum]